MIKRRGKGSSSIIDNYGSEEEDKVDLLPGERVSNVMFDQAFTKK